MQYTPSDGDIESIYSCIMAETESIWEADCGENIDIIPLNLKLATLAAKMKFENVLTKDLSVLFGNCSNTILGKFDIYINHLAERVVTGMASGFNWMFMLEKHDKDALQEIAVRLNMRMMHRMEQNTLLAAILSRINFLIMKKAFLEEGESNES